MPDAQALLKHLTTPLSAEDLAQRLGLTVAETLAALAEHWWPVVPVTGDWKGWRYAKRSTLSKVVKIADADVKQYHGTGVTTGRETVILARTSQ